jgi:hypothetical protein
MRLNDSALSDLFRSVQNNEMDDRIKPAVNTTFPGPSVNGKMLHAILGRVKNDIRQPTGVPVRGFAHDVLD